MQIAFAWDPQQHVWRVSVTQNVLNKTRLDSDGVDLWPVACDLAC